VAAKGMIDPRMPLGSWSNGCSYRREKTKNRSDKKFASDETGSSRSATRFSRQI